MYDILKNMCNCMMQTMYVSGDICIVRKLLCPKCMYVALYWCNRKGCQMYVSMYVLNLNKFQCLYVKKVLRDPEVYVL